MKAILRTIAIALAFVSAASADTTRVPPQGTPNGGSAFYANLRIGSTDANTQGLLSWNTIQTVDTNMLLTGSISNCWVIAEAADAAFDFAHAQAVDPCLFIHSHNQNTTQWISLTHDGTNAVVNAGAGALLLATATTNRIGVGTLGPTLRVDGTYGWASGTDVTAAKDAFFGRKAAASIQMGADVNGAAITQTFGAAAGITGTDVIGSGLTLQSGLGTGAGVSQPLTLNRQVTKATGTTAQTYAPAVIVCTTKLLSTTSAVTTVVADITTTSTTGGSVTWDYTVIANNGTLQDVDGGVLKVSWGNNAGTVTSTATAVILQSDADASGTLAATPTRTDATNVVSLKLTPTWVTIVPTTVTAISTFTVASVGDTVSCK